MDLVFFASEGIFLLRTFFTRKDHSLCVYIVLHRLNMIMALHQALKARRKCAGMLYILQYQTSIKSNWQHISSHAPLYISSVQDVVMAVARTSVCFFHSSSIRLGPSFSPLFQTTPDNTINCKTPSFLIASAFEHFFSSLFQHTGAKTNFLSRNYQDFYFEKNVNFVKNDALKM